jgi:hypothetical protein
VGGCRGGGEALRAVRKRFVLKTMPDVHDACVDTKHGGVNTARAAQCRTNVDTAPLHACPSAASCFLQSAMADATRPNPLLAHSMQPHLHPAPPPYRPTSHCLTAYSAMASWPGITDSTTASTIPPPWVLGMGAGRRGTPGFHAEVLLTWYGWGGGKPMVGCQACCKPRAEAQAHS